MLLFFDVFELVPEFEVEAVVELLELGTAVFDLASVGPGLVSFAFLSSVSASFASFVPAAFCVSEVEVLSVVLVSSLDFSLVSGWLEVAFPVVSAPLSSLPEHAAPPKHSIRHSIETINFLFILSSFLL